MASSTHEDVDWEVPCDKNWHEDPRVKNQQLPPQWFKTSNGSDPFPDFSHGPIYKVKDRDKKRQELDTITDDDSAALCKDLPGSIAAMGNYCRGALKMSDLSELMSHYDRLAGYNPEKRETPQNTLFCGPESEETWRMR
ncbi:unnamed protein product, partial [Symbiodinium sp. KB8]